jgi:hypothetical protein
MMGFHAGSLGFGEWLAMSVMMLAFVGLLAALCVWLWRVTWPSSPPAEGGDASPNSFDRAHAEAEGTGHARGPRATLGRTP